MATRSGPVLGPGPDRAPFAAVVGVLQIVLEILEKGGGHVGVATDHVVESFRNGLWPGCKTGEDIEPTQWALARASSSPRRSEDAWQPPTNRGVLRGP